MGPGVLRQRLRRWRRQIGFGEAHFAALVATVSGERIGRCGERGGAGGGAGERREAAVTGRCQNMCELSVLFALGAPL